MELKLLVEAPSGARVDVAVEVEPDTPQHEFIAALARYLELPPDAARSALLERSGVRLGGDMPVGEAGLRDGDRLRLGDGTPTSAPAGNGVLALVDLTVVAGPGTGTRRPLTEGGTSSAAVPAPTWSCPTAPCRGATSPRRSHPPA